MLPLALSPPSGRELRVLCLGAHCDDIEIGCGGTLLRLVGSGRPLRVHWLVLCSNEERRREAQACAQAFLGAGPEAKVVVEDLRDGFLPARFERAKEIFEALKAEIDPDVIFTTTRSDLHQDHRTVCELTWQTFRNHLILEYEILKYDGDLGAPNAFVPLSEELVARKCRLLREGYPSQARRSWFSEEAFRALLKVRGIEAAAPEGYAEAFYCRKLRLES
jgi:LmbE family N-acetylglucosaminyl deacetylase